LWAGQKEQPALRKTIPAPAAAAVSFAVLVLFGSEAQAQVRWHEALFDKSEERFAPEWAQSSQIPAACDAHRFPALDARRFPALLRPAQY
jgi:hypothetical protein